MKETDGFGYFSPQLQQKGKELFAAPHCSRRIEEVSAMLPKELPAKDQRKNAGSKTNNAVPNWIQPNPALHRKLAHIKNKDNSLPDRQQSKRHPSYNTETPRSRGEEFRHR